MTEVKQKLFTEKYFYRKISTETLDFFKKNLLQDISTRGNILLILKSTDRWFYGE